MGNVVHSLISIEAGTAFCIMRSWGLAQRYDLDDEHAVVGRKASDFKQVGGRLTTRQ
jgi:hypothetical protein